jgi:hypothetical protein
MARRTEIERILSREELREFSCCLYLKAEYSQALGQHWRATAGFALLRDDPTDFLGQYRRNSHAILTLRYSF